MVRVPDDSPLITPRFCMWAMPMAQVELSSKANDRVEKTCAGRSCIEPLERGLVRGAPAGHYACGVQLTSGVPNYWSQRHSSLDQCVQEEMQAASSALADERRCLAETVPGGAADADMDSLNLAAVHQQLDFDLQPAVAVVPLPGRAANRRVTSERESLPAASVMRPEYRRDRAERCPSRN